MDEQALLVTYWLSLGIWSGFILSGTIRYTKAWIKWRKNITRPSDGRMVNMTRECTFVFLMFCIMAGAATIFVGEFTIEVMIRVLIGRTASIVVVWRLNRLLEMQQQSFSEEEAKREHEAVKREIEERQRRLREALDAE